MKKDKLSKALADLDQAFENLEVQPLSDDDLGRTGGACGNTSSDCTGFFCNSNVTCNSKCGPTCYWECG